MKFIDYATIRVIAGKGGNGCLSFLREKYRPKGGPDGGDGGHGGSIYMRGNSGLNTLADFRYTRLYKGQNGESGAGKDCSGRNGEDLIVEVPLGSVIYDHETEEVIGDIVENGQMLLVAQGGYRGLGNARFKSSTNQTPRQTTSGTLGEERELRIELKVLADVGLLGLPNAGKSTLLSAISSAKPKIADYPFTTLHPQLGVVDMGDHNSFVMADIPGLIEGAAQGVGLGFRFLRHLQRTGLLLHMIDISSFDIARLAKEVQDIEKELNTYDETLLGRERWLVLNKMDVMPEDDHIEFTQDLVAALDWQNKFFSISAATGQGCQDLCNEIMQYLLALRESESKTEHKS